MESPPFSDLYQDVYFSAAGGFAEKNYVFVEGTALLDHMSKKTDTTVFEAGFGSGLSFLAAARACLAKAPSGHRLHFYSAEKHPMTADMARAALMPFCAEIGHDLVHSLLQNWPPSIPGVYHLSFGNRVFLTLHIGDINDVLPSLDMGVDAWFLDGFSPRKNPDMWTDTLFAAMARLSMPDATAATYSAARSIRDGLQSAGFNVHKTKGFGYKSDMVIARYQGTGYSKTRSVQHGKRVLIYGGGLAAAAAAYMLRLYGHHPCVIAPHGLGDAASGNPRGLFNPKITGSIDGVHSLFYNGAYAQFIHFLKSVHPEYIDLLHSGALHLAADADILSKMDRMAKSLGWESYAHVMSPSEAQDCAGIPVNSGGLFFPASGSLSPKKLIDFYMRDIQILPYIDEKDVSNFDHIVIGAARASSEFIGFEDLPLQSIRGHISIMSETPASSALLTHLCYGGYLSPSYQGQHVLGSTFQAWMDSPDIQSADHTYVIDKLHQATPPFFTESDIKGGRVSFRTATPDRMPVIGSRIAHHRTVYISTAHGSHGIITSLFAARMIAQDISQIPISVSKSVIQSVSPDRFAFQEKKSKVSVS